MSTYSIVLFDLDGTLTDPKVGITKSVQYALSKMGINEPSLDTLIPFIGPPLHVSFQQHYGFNLAEAEQAVTYYREYFGNVGIYENILYDGIPEVLQVLKAQSHRLVVATSKPTVFAKKILSHFEIDHFFDHAVGSKLDGTRSNKAEIVEHVISLYGNSSKEHFVMIGDRKHDIVGAQANGLDSIGVMYGYGSKEELLLANPTHIAHTVPELLEVLNHHLTF